MTEDAALYEAHPLFDLAQKVAWLYPNFVMQGNGVLSLFVDENVANIGFAEEAAQTSDIFLELVV